MKISYKKSANILSIIYRRLRLQRDFTGLCYVNLVDFDALWGHRRDPYGYAQEIERFDVKLGDLLKLSTKMTC